MISKFKFSASSVSKVGKF